MTTTEPSTTVRMSEAWPWLFRIAGPVLGFGLGSVVAPVVRWLLERFDTAPGPLRILAGLPGGWAVAVTTVIGLAGGIWLAAVARREGLSVTVGSAQVELRQDGTVVRLARGRVVAARRDGADLVLLDDRGAEPARRKGSDLSWAALQTAFERHGYRWDGSTERDDRFRPWVDGSADLGADEHDLLRARSRAVADDRTGLAEELREQLQTRGVVLRDRADAQEIRAVGPATSTPFTGPS